MKTLIEAVENWIDERILLASGMGELEARFNDMQEIHIRDANRIAALERRVMGLDEDNSFDGVNHIDISQRLESLESTVEEVESRVDEAYSMAESNDSQGDDHEYRISELEQRADEDIDYGDVISVVRDSLEESIVDAVRTEIDAVDFKVTVER